MSKVNHASTSGIKPLHSESSLNFKTMNTRLAKRIAFSSLGDFAPDFPHSASLSDFRSEVMHNLSKVNKFKSSYNKNNQFNDQQTNSSILIQNNNSSQTQFPISFNNISNNNKDTFSSQSITKFFNDEKTASVNSKADIHRKIMEIGDNLHGNLIRDLQIDYDKRLKQKEAELSEAYKREREMQVEKERSKFSEKLESIKSQLKKDYERLLRDRANEIETYTQNVAKEQIELNKIEAKRVLEDTVRKQREQFEIEKFEAVEEAIIKEKQMSETRLDEQRKKYENKYEELNEKWLTKLNVSIQEQRAKFNKEIEKTIQLSCEQVVSDKNEEIERLKDVYENKLDLAKFELQLKLDDVSQLNSKVNALNYENDQLKEMIEDLKNELQNCITRFSHLKKNDNDFLFPVNTASLENKTTTIEKIKLTKLKK